jgi:hypothetical protein
MHTPRHAKCLRPTCRGHVSKVAERERWEEEYERQQEEIKELRKRIKDTVRQTAYRGRPPKDNDKMAYDFFFQYPQAGRERGSSSHLGSVELIALTGSLFHAQTNGLFHIIEELLPKCEEEP